MRRTGTVSGPLAAWAVTRAALLLCVFHVIDTPGQDVTSDVSVIYRGWFETLSGGSFPVDDVTWQYPPAAALVILSPAVFTGLGLLGYASAFYVLACAADAAVLALLLYARRRTGARRAGVWVWVVGVPLLGPTAYARYDLMVTALAVAALVAAVSHPRTAGALASLGAMVKVWPALLLLGTPRGRASRAAWTTAVAVAALLTAGFAATMPGALDFLHAQEGRGTEIESLGALVLHVARHFGWEGQVLLNYGSMEFLGPHVDVVSGAALVLSVLAGGWMLLWRIQAVEWTPSTPADAAFAAVLLFTTTSRVLSPQYMIWLVGLAAVCLSLRASRLALPAALVLAATALTALEFPVWFTHVVASDWRGIVLLAARNGLLVAASALACARLWQDTVTGPKRRAAEARESAAAVSRPERLLTW
ncbi:glycosyltransferase 87 family protein [Streptomyces sp. NPDC048172]|uniref:glycosyltransferase 87 family protein n=1 Tax=Streptomyces sp. NPDC048172 TaxID=3365505 RepID=UPI00372283CB